MARDDATQQYVLMPTRGTRVRATTPDDAQSFLARAVPVGAGPLAMSVRASSARGPAHAMRVIDSVHEDGTKLVEMTPAAAMAFRVEQPGLRLLPVVWFWPAVAPARGVFAASATLAKAPATAKKITVALRVKATGAPLVGATVVAFTDFGRRYGAQATSKASGKASLPFPGAKKRLDAIFVYPSTPGTWGFFARAYDLVDGATIDVETIVPGYADCLRHHYGVSPLDAGTGVKVGVIDTGIARHDDLVIVGGRNTVVGEDPDDYFDSGAGHGTHVAGIVAGRGTAPKGMRGIAPGVTLRSYRVFGRQRPGAEGPGASNYAIVKAIDRAVADGCDMLNLSLGGGGRDEATEDAIKDARDHGVLAIVAAGNEDRSAVSFPARYALSLAVSAVGRVGTFPSTALAAGDVAAPRGKDKKDFLAAFSNVGPELDLCGPGSGVVSTFPGGYEAMSGTSMACPAVTGAAARLLGGHPEILAMPRDGTRADAMAKAILASATSLGFAARFEGHGIPGR